jgi:hypothetical protein
VKIQLWRKGKNPGEIEVEDWDDTPQFPHCDTQILHAPGECEYCDRHPDWQTMRRWWRINFTGHHDPLLAPCPSTHLRTDEQRDSWPGNTPEGWLTP